MTTSSRLSLGSSVRNQQIPLQAAEVFHHRRGQITEPRVDAVKHVALAGLRQQKCVASLDPGLRLVRQFKRAFVRVQRPTSLCTPPALWQDISAFARAPFHADKIPRCAYLAGSIFPHEILFYLARGDNGVDPLFVAFRPKRSSSNRIR